MKEIDNTPIENLDVDWGNPDGTGRKAKSLEQVQSFIKDKFKDLPVLRFDAIEEFSEENTYHSYDVHTSATRGSIVFITGKFMTFMYKVGNDYYCKWKSYTSFVEDFPSIPGLPPQPVGGKIYVCNNVLYMYRNRHLVELKAGDFLELNQRNYPQIIEGSSSLRICNPPLNFILPELSQEETLILSTDYKCDGTSKSTFNSFLTNKCLCFILDETLLAELFLKEGFLELSSTYGPCLTAIQFKQDIIFIGTSENIREQDYAMASLRDPSIGLGRAILRGIKTPEKECDAANKQYVDKSLITKQDKKKIIYIDEITDDNYMFQYQNESENVVIRKPLNHDLLVQIGPGEDNVEVSFEFKIGDTVPIIDFFNHSDLWIRKPNFRPNTRYIVKLLRRMTASENGGMFYIGDCEEFGCDNVKIVHELGLSPLDVISQRAITGELSKKQNKLTIDFHEEKITSTTTILLRNNTRYVNICPVSMLENHELVINLNNTGESPVEYAELDFAIGNVVPLIRFRIAPDFQWIKIPEFKPNTRYLISFDLQGLNYNVPPTGMFVELPLV